MTATAEPIVAEALELPPSVRAFVAEKLIKRLDATPTAELSPEGKGESNGS